MPRKIFLIFLHLANHMFYNIIIVQVIHYYWNKGSCPCWI